MLGSRRFLFVLRFQGSRDAGVGFRIVRMWGGEGGKYGSFGTIKGCKFRTQCFTFGLRGLRGLVV